MSRLLRDDTALEAPDEHDAHVSPGRVPVTARIAGRPQFIFRVASVEAARELAGALGPRDDNGVAAGADVAVDRAASSSGAALPGDVRSRFESSLGADLSGVRVHTGTESAAAASAVGARAYTVGNDIHFADGQYTPGDPFGLHLLAHEVAHTQQQAGAAPHRQNKLEVSTPGDTAEVEADRAADAMVSGAPAMVSGASGVARMIQRDAAPKPGAQGGDASADPAKTMDASVIVSQIGQAYQSLMEFQMEGLKRLGDDLDTPDKATIADEVIKIAVVGALTAATGLLAEAIIGSVVASVVEAKITADQVAKGVANAEKAAAAADKAAAAAAASSTAKLIVDKVKGGTTAAVEGAFKDTGASSVTHLFVESARQALIAQKQVAQFAVDEAAPTYQSSPYGHAQASAMLDAVKAQQSRAIETQYMFGLSQMNGMRGSGVGGWTVTIAPYQLGGKPTVKSASLGCDGAVRERLKRAFGSHQLKDFPMGMIVRIEGAFHVFSGSQGLSLSGSTGGQVESFPDDGPGQHMLAEFFPLQDPSKPVPEDQIANQARNAAFIIWGDVQSLTIAQLGAFGG